MEQQDQKPAEGAATTSPTTPAATAPEPVTTPTEAAGPNKMLSAVLGLLVVGLLAAAGFLYYQNMQLQKKIGELETATPAPTAAATPRATATATPSGSPKATATPSASPSATASPTTTPTY